MGRDQHIYINKFKNNTISIHAPVGGATVKQRPSKQLKGKFQSTRPYGARRLINQISGAIKDFNPRARMGRDSLDYSRLILFRYISIHAPVWGATYFFICYFYKLHQFQSTRPYGARLMCNILTLTLFVYFNPRARMGRDVYRSTKKGCSIQISIHAPVWGATDIQDQAIDDKDIFQSTRPYGARPKMLTSRQDTGEISIHAPVWGAT